MCATLMLCDGQVWLRKFCQWRNLPGMIHPDLPTAISSAIDRPESAAILYDYSFPSVFTTLVATEKTRRNSFVLVLPLLPDAGHLQSETIAPGRRQPWRRPARHRRG
jgi:hypothetical protein